MSVASRCCTRWAVVGTSGSGKTILAARLAALLAVPHVELDALHWEANWQEVPDSVMAERVRAATASAAWVVDGNYSAVHDLIWSRAEGIVWLDYPLRIVMGRVLWRTVRRLFNREVLWGNNRESWRMAFSRDSIILWALNTHGRNRRRYARLFADPTHRHLQKVHLRHPAAAEQWLATLAATRDDTR